MKLSVLFRHWWVILIQGILMIAVSIIVFNNPDTVLVSMAFWFGLMVIMAGIAGVFAWLSNASEDRDFLPLIGSLGIVILGILMISKVFVTMKAITLVFGLIVTVIGLTLISESWKRRKDWSYWWLIALLGAGALMAGIKSILDVNSGAQNISYLVGISILLSGIGLIFLSFLKRT